jgi:hypothetical protein
VAGAQVADNRATVYLHPTSVTDARAVWLNPAGPAAAARASLYHDVTVRNPGALGRLGQVTAGFNSRGLSFGYQRDVFGDTTGHTYRVGLASAARRIAFGAAVALYRGGTAGTGWDVGVRYAPAPAVTLGGTIANISEPVVRGLRQELTFVPGATLTPFGSILALSTHARLTRDAVLGYALGAHYAVPLARLAAIVRLDTDNRLRRASFAFGIAIGGQNSVGAVVTTSGDLRDADAVSLYGLVSRSVER